MGCIWLHDQSCHQSWLSMIGCGQTSRTIGRTTGCTMSQLAERPVVTDHDQLYDFNTGRMTGLPLHIKRCSIKHQYEYSFNFLTVQC